MTGSTPRPVGPPSAIRVENSGVGSAPCCAPPSRHPSHPATGQDTRTRADSPTSGGASSRHSDVHVPRGDFSMGDTFGEGYPLDGAGVGGLSEGSPPTSSEGGIDLGAVPRSTSREGSKAMGAIILMFDSLNSHMLMSHTVDALVDNSVSPAWPRSPRRHPVHLGPPSRVRWCRRVQRWSA